MLSGRGRLSVLAPVPLSASGVRSVSTPPKSKLVRLPLGIKALAVSFPTSLYSFSSSANLCFRSELISSSPCCASRSFKRSANCFFWSRSVVPSLLASWIRRSVSTICASRARLACEGEPRAKEARSLESSCECRRDLDRSRLADSGVILNGSASVGLCAVGVDMSTTGP